MSTKIEWAEETWNPIIGCSKVSPGCDHCYAERMAGRISAMALKEQEMNEEYIKDGKGCYPFVVKNGKWNGKTELVHSTLEKPLHWKKPRTIFVCSMGDLFHESVPFEWIDKVMAVMAICPQHTFQVLTKRPKRMAEYFSRETLQVRIMTELDLLAEKDEYDKLRPCPSIVAAEMWANGFQPLPNLWLGVTAENQEMANKRIPILLQIPAAKRFVSVEPMLGPVKLNQLIREEDGYAWCDDSLTGFKAHGAGGWYANKLDWVICGGESGPGARPMHPDWARSLRDQCNAAGVPYFFKQWGEWGPTEWPNTHCAHIGEWTTVGCGKPYFKKGEMCNPEVYGPRQAMWRIGKKKAGHLLDGKEWRERP